MCDFLKIEVSCKSCWFDSNSNALADNLGTLADLLRFPSIVSDLLFLDAFVCVSADIDSSLVSSISG